MTYRVNDIDTAKIQALASCGVNRDIIAQYMGLNHQTITKYYSEVIARARTDRNMLVANALFENAVKHKNVAAQIFWLKTQAQWKDEQVVEDKGDTDTALLDHIAGFLKERV